jgi:predicted metal-dependent phosphotriesterase family hydrolase
MQLVLPKCVLNNSVSKKLSKQIKEKPIDDYGWAFLIKNFIDKLKTDFIFVEKIAKMMVIFYMT